MISVLFPTFFEISCLAVTLTLSSETGWFFGERFYQKRTMINSTAFVASLFAASYTAYKLLYFFLGIGTNQCEEFKIITGLFQGLSNFLAFLHLFLRAEKINSLYNTKNWEFWNRVGIFLNASYLVVLLVVSFLRTATKIYQEDGMHCQLSFETVSFAMKWIIQLINHVVFSALFVYPLISHIFNMRKLDIQRRRDGVQFSSRTDSSYNRLVWRAVAAMVASTLFTATVTVLIFIQQKNSDLKIPLVALSILDNGLTLGSIYFANGGSPTAWDREVSPRRNERQSIQSSVSMVNNDRETWPSLSPQSPQEIQICVMNEQGTGRTNRASLYSAAPTFRGSVIDE